MVGRNTCAEGTRPTLSAVSDDPAFVWTAGSSQARRVRRQPQTTLPRAGSENADAGVDVFDLETTDAVLVPVDEWSRILRQLGNLHDAGQQLAEARERAAKAETESTFLRERLRDARDQAQRLQTQIDATPEPEPEPLPGFGEWFVRRWLEKRTAR